MTGEIVNLRRMRKRLRREEAAQGAAENRARFGRTQEERDRDQREAAQAARVLDGARLTDQAGDAKPAENRAKDRQTTS